MNNMKKARKVFIFGVGGFGRSAAPGFPDEVKDVARGLIKSGAEILVGDCRGVDYLAQSYLKSEKYKNVTVYHSGAICRNKLDPDWKSMPVPSGARGRAFYTAKDIAACAAADEGIAVWDGISEGTGRNIGQMRAEGRPVRIYRLDEGRFEA